MKSEKSQKGSLLPVTILNTDKLYAHHNFKEDNAQPEVQFVPTKKHRNDDIENLITVTRISKKSSSF